MHVTDARGMGSEAYRITEQRVLPFRQTGGAGWVLVAALVLAWDAVAPETLSAAFARARSTPAGRALATAGWAVLTAHLFNQIPRQADPLHLFLVVVRYRRGHGCEAAGAAA